MKALVLSLERAVERRRLIADNLARIGIGFTVFRALDGAAGEHLPVSRYDEAQCLKRFGAPLSPGEVACFASHYLIWQDCARDGEAVIVIEDDVVLTERFPEALALAAERIAQHGFIRLAGKVERRYRVIEEIAGRRRLVRYLRGPLGTQCYALSPVAAERLVAKAALWVEPVDLYLDAFWRHGVASKGLLPFEAQERAEAETPSLIGARPKRRRGLFKWRREAWRVAEKASRLAYNARHG